MNPYQPSALLFSHQHPTLADDSEVLQTDVMRFFAILCLCLMAIFALVKALPMAQSADQPTIAQPPDLSAAARSLQLQIAMLKKELALTRTQVQAASRAAEQASLQAEQAAAEERETVSRLARTRQNLKQVAQTLDQTRRELKEREQKMAGLVNDIDQKQRIRSGLSAQIQDETRNLKKLRAALDRVDEKVAQSRHPEPQPSPAATDAKPPRQDPTAGYILRFASDAALQSLVAGGQVSFYAMAGKKAWRLRLTAGRPDYVASENPPQIYEMENATVPAGFAAAFHRHVAAFGPGAVTWGVTLPAQTTASINRLIRGPTGGELVIMPDGEVDLN